MTNLVRLAPSPINSIIAEEEVNISRLASILDSAVIEQSIDSDGDLYASDGLDFPAWVSINQNEKLIVFTTYFSHDYGLQGVINRANNANRKAPLVQFYWVSNRLWGNYWLTYDGGVDVKHFVKMLRRFSRAFRAGIAAFEACEIDSKLKI